MEQLDKFLLASRIQSSTEPGLMYLWVTNWVHKLSVVKSLQQALAARALEKMKLFFSPQPPNAFSRANLSHFSQDKV